jgi:hypothetical protein
MKPFLSLFVVGILVGCSSQASQWGSDSSDTIPELAKMVAASDFALLGPRYFRYIFIGKQRQCIIDHRQDIFGDVLIHEIPSVITQEQIIFIDSYNSCMVQLHGRFASVSDMEYYYNSRLQELMQSDSDIKKLFDGAHGNAVRAPQ